MKLRTISQAKIFSMFMILIMIGCEITPSEHKLFSLPTTLGGLGILDLTTSASRFYQASMSTVCTVFQIIGMLVCVDVSAF